MNNIADIINEMNDYIAAHGKKGYKDYAAAIRNWIRRRKNEVPKDSQFKKRSKEYEQNKQYLSQAMTRHPEAFKEAMITEKYVQNTSNHKDIPFEMDPESFKTALSHVFGREGR